VATYLSGKKPREVAVDSMTGYAYVTNSEDNSLSVFRDGMPVTTIELPENKGFNPWYVTIDEESGRVFVLNRSSIKRSSSLGTDVVECKRPWLHILE
jgi:DNA-binding beta-propeller fold protein YncE